MGDIKTVHAVLTKLLERGKGDEWLSAEHDVIYLPLEEDDAEAEWFREHGCHYESDVDSWAMFT